MYTLGFDTTTRKTRLALLKKDRVIFEREWKTNANEAETVIKTIKTITESEPLLFQNLKKIIAIHGPGGFNGTRAGVTIANTLSWLTKGEIIPHNTFNWWKKRLKKESQKLRPHLILKITEQEIFIDGKPLEFHKFAKEMKKRKSLYYAYGEITPTQHFTLKNLENFMWIDEMELKSFAEVLKELGGRGRSSPISPLYARPPVITKAKKKTKFV